MEQHCREDVSSDEDMQELKEIEDKLTQAEKHINQLL
jgi:hypothetical protein